MNHPKTFIWNLCLYLLLLLRFAKKLKCSLTVKMQRHACETNKSKVFEEIQQSRRAV